MTTTITRAAGTLTRQAHEYRARRVAFWHRGTGQIVSDVGPGATITSDAPLSYVLTMIAATRPDARVRVLYIIGGETVASEPPRAWWAEPVAAGGWQYDGYELATVSGEGGHENAGTYTRDGVTVDVRMAARWFPGVSDPLVCIQAWRMLGARLRLDFDEHATLLTTPAATGLDLLHRSLPRGARGHAAIEYPPAPEALRDVLYHQVGQGRMQYCPAPGVAGTTAADGLWTLDARWMYAACVSHLPVGEPTHTTWLEGEDELSGAYLPYVVAWYRVNAMVPPGWAHLGLLPQRNERDGVTVWPDRPGDWVQDAWVSGAELALAIAHGWPVMIYERWAYEDSERTPGSDPAARWARTLRTLRAQSEPACYGDAAAPMAGALRHLLIDTIGMWHRQEGQKLRITPPADVRGPVHHFDTRAKLAYWYESVPLGREGQAFSRPEWSAAVWGRARARLHTAMLRVPRRDIVALRSDAMVLTRPPVGWPADDGQPGTFRLKARREGPVIVSEREIAE